jgi:hypothetical protein
MLKSGPDRTARTEGGFGPDRTGPGVDTDRTGPKKSRSACMSACVWHYFLIKCLEASSHLIRERPDAYFIL